jgi:hypothetical protein
MSRCIESDSSVLFFKGFVASIRGQSGPFLIRIRILGYLHCLAQLRNVHRLPTTDLLHASKELASRTGSIHITSYVLVVSGALLEDPNTVMIFAGSIVRVVERGLNFGVS